MVKLDKEFINNIFSSDQDKIVVESVINLIKELKLKIVAEGIETKEQLDFLKNNQCDFGQGYYFSKPVPKDEWIHIITGH
jgi:EAL domain-containing protein (putative c-di-GMP-specific phosphodiesterase class I)